MSATLARITVVGVVEAMALPVDARRALATADLVVGSDRLLDAVPAAAAARRVVLGEVGPALDVVAGALAGGRPVCVLASGDPGFFGIVRALAERFGRGCLDVHPAPSSVALAFARLGMPWDDAAVVSAHGRPLAAAALAAARAPKVAVLTAPGSAGQDIGAALLRLGASHEHAAVCRRLGTDSEEVSVTDLPGLAAGTWDPLAVVILWSGPGVAACPSLAWGLPTAAYSHRDGMITKPEVRSVVMGLLALPGPSGQPVLWDVGAGSGSVAVECAGVAPWVDVVAVDRDPAAAAAVTANSRAHGTAVRVVTGDAPECLAGLPDPDRVFVGGGGIEVLEAARARLRPEGIVVATHAAIERAAAAATLLGNLTAITANHGQRLPAGGWRLAGANPVFVTWGGTGR